MAEDGILPFQLPQPCFARQHVAVTWKRFVAVLLCLVSPMRDRALAQAQFAFDLRHGPPTSLGEPDSLQFEFSGIRLASRAHADVLL